MRARSVVEARVDAQRMVLATQSALDADGDLLQAAERQAIDAAMDAVRALTANDDAAAIEAQTKQLAEATEAFAAQRMNRGIALALSGQNIAAL